MKVEGGNVDGSASPRWWCDTHVHLHARFGVGAFLDAAASNLAAAGAAAGRGVLSLTECAGVHAFRGMREGGSAGAWSFGAWGEHGVRARRDDGVSLGVIAGRQVRCGNGLEVLGLGRDFDVDDGGGLRETVDAVRAAGAWAVVPYGVGKWSGARGRAVRGLIEDGPAGVAFGDNAGRVGWGEQTLLARARAAGRTVLVGTDPLDLDGAVGHAGRWGVMVEAEDDAAAVAAALGAAGPRPATFGRRRPMGSALADQVRLRL
ncbi:MAG: hypothetical protein AAF800_01860 [Planctomycetota bacterium]